MDAFATGGIANPLTVIEQFTYLIFIRRLDERQLLEEKIANRKGIPVQKEIYSSNEKGEVELIQTQGSTNYV